MKKTTNGRLQLERNTLRRLTDANLEQVQGGISRVCGSYADCGSTFETAGCMTPACNFTHDWV